MSVFVDTSALYALLVRTEEDHDATVAAFERLVRSHRPLLTTNYVLLETTALLQRRFGLTAVRDFETRVVPLLAVRWVDEALHRRGMERLLQSDRRQLSLVDCASFGVMDAEGIDEALALDADFRTEGYRVLPAG
jgi:predicted nucleic acid-binding protein